MGQNSIMENMKVFFNGIFTFAGDKSNNWI